MNTRQYNRVGADLRDLDIAVWASGLPAIRGRWIYVDPNTGSNGPGNDGLSKVTAVKDFLTAYAAAKDGDGICLLSSGNTAAATTSYLNHEHTFAKHGLTVFGVCSGGRMFQRARIATKNTTTGALTVLSFLRGTTSPDTINRTAGSFITDGFQVGDVLRVTTTGGGATSTGHVIAAVSALTLTLATTGTLVTETAIAAGSSTVNAYCPNAITVTGDNNRFINVHIANQNSDALSLGGLVESGNRNTYINVHAIGGGACAASASISSLEVKESEEAAFIGCTFGTDTVDRGDFASCEVLFTGKGYRARFYDCEMLSFITDGTAHGAVKTAANTALGRDAVFKNCEFHASAQNGVLIQAEAFIGTAPTTGVMYVIGGAGMGYTAWASDANDRVYVDMPTTAANAGGGLCTVK